MSALLPTRILLTLSEACSSMFLIQFLISGGNHPAQHSASLWYNIIIGQLDKERLQTKLPQHLAPPEVFQQYWNTVAKPWYIYNEHFRVLKCSKILLILQFSLYNKTTVDNSAAQMNLSNNSCSWFRAQHQELTAQRTHNVWHSLDGKRMCTVERGFICNVVNQQNTHCTPIVCCKESRDAAIEISQRNITALNKNAGQCTDLAPSEFIVIHKGKRNGMKTAIWQSIILQ